MAPILSEFYWRIQLVSKTVHYNTSAISVQLLVAVEVKTGTSTYNLGDQSVVPKEAGIYVLNH